MIYQNLKNKNLIVFVNLGQFLLICQKIKFWHLDHFASPRLKYIINYNINSKYYNNTPGQVQLALLVSIVATSTSDKAVSSNLCR